MGDLPEIVYRRSVDVIGMARHLLGKPEPAWLRTSSSARVVSRISSALMIS